MICLNAMVPTKQLGLGSNWWQEDGVRNNILATAQEHAYVIERLDLEIVAVDSTLLDSKKAASQQGTTAISDAKE